MGEPTRWSRGSIGHSDAVAAAAGSETEPEPVALRHALRVFLAELIHHRPRRLALLIAVQVASSVCQTLALLLLIPLLGAVGVDASSGLARTIRGVFSGVGLRPTLVLVLAVYVGLTALSSGLGAVRSVLGTRYRLEFVDGLRARVYGALARSGWGHLLGLRRSDVITVLNANVTATGQAVMSALAIVVAAMLSISQLVASVEVSPTLTGLAFFSGLVLVAVVWPLVRRSRELGRTQILRNRATLAVATGFLDSLKLTKAYGCEEEHVGAYTAALADARAPQIDFTRVSSVAGAAQSTLTAGMLAVTVLVAVRVTHVPLSYLLVIALVFGRVTGLMMTAQSNIQQIAQALPALEEVRTMVAECEAAAELSPAGDDTLAAPEHRSERVRLGDGLRLDDVHFTYPTRLDGTEALGGVSLWVPAGSMVALVGPTGAGKTTLADLAVGLMAPCSGQITVGGRLLTRALAPRWRESVALVPQDPFLFHDTVRANLLWARPDAAEEDLRQALRQAAADGFVSGLPHGLDTVVGDRGLRLSGGERQRIALARALLREPELLILDEATSAVDTATERAIREALAELRGRTTMLVIAHRLSTAREADEIVVLEAGRVVETGSWERLSRLPAGRLAALIDANDAPVRPAARGRRAPAVPAPVTSERRAAAG